MTKVTEQIDQLISNSTVISTVQEHLKRIKGFSVKKKKGNFHLLDKL